MAFSPCHSMSDWWWPFLTLSQYVWLVVALSHPVIVCLIGDGPFFSCHDMSDWWWPFFTLSGYVWLVVVLSRSVTVCLIGSGPFSPCHSMSVRVDCLELSPSLSSTGDWWSGVMARTVSVTLCAESRCVYVVCCIHCVQSGTCGVRVCVCSTVLIVCIQDVCL